MATESAILNDHLEMANEMSRPSPWAFDGGSRPGQPSVNSQPAKRSSCPSRGGYSTRPLSGVCPSPHKFMIHTPHPISARRHQATTSSTCRLLSLHPVGAQFSLPSQIQTKLWILPVSAVYHFEIYTILAERTELYCIHDAIKHFTRNQCKTDEAWK